MKKFNNNYNNYNKFKKTPLSLYQFQFRSNKQKRKISIFLKINKKVSIIIQKSINNNFITIVVFNYFYFINNFFFLLKKINILSDSNSAEQAKLINDLRTELEFCDKTIESA